jgi:hypothetical protein
LTLETKSVEPERSAGKSRHVIDHDTASPAALPFARPVDDTGFR